MLGQLSQAEGDLRRLGEFIHDILSNINKILTPKYPYKSHIFLCSVGKNMRLICFVGNLTALPLSLATDEINHKPFLYIFLSPIELILPLVALSTSHQHLQARNQFTEQYSSVRIVNVKVLPHAVLPDMFLAILRTLLTSNYICYTLVGLSGVEIGQHFFYVGLLTIRKYNTLSQCAD
jgi:hypothetical protein